VRGQTPEAAKALLEGLGFSYLDGGPIDSEFPAGKVANTDPAPGTQSGVAAIITVFTSKGNKVAFPDVVGDGKWNDFASAKSILNGQGYSTVAQGCEVLKPAGGPGPVLPTDPRVGKVQSSDPPPGSIVLPGVSVTLTVGEITCP